MVRKSPRQGLHLLWVIIHAASVHAHGSERSGKPLNFSPHSMNGPTSGCPRKKPLNHQGRTSRRKMTSLHQAFFQGIYQDCNRDTTDYTYQQKKSCHYQIIRHRLVKVFHSNKFDIPCLWMKDKKVFVVSG